MEYLNGVLTIKGESVELNPTQIHGLEIYAHLIFVAAKMLNPKPEVIKS